MSGKLFVNYRRGDDAGFTHALYLRLEAEFSAGDVFMDVEGQIKPGDDFVEVINAQVAAADVVLVVIGPRWADLLAARAGAGVDHVVTEIEAALEQRKRVIPVLVGGAIMPPADLLPASIRALARRHAVGLRPERFKADCQALVTALRDYFAAAGSERAARRDAEQAAARIAEIEADQRRHEERGPESVRRRRTDFLGDPKRSTIARFLSPFGRPFWMNRPDAGASNEGDHKGRHYRIDMA